MKNHNCHHPIQQIDLFRNCLAGTARPARPSANKKVVIYLGIISFSTNTHLKLVFSHDVFITKIFVYKTDYFQSPMNEFEFACYLDLISSACCVRL